MKPIDYLKERAAQFALNANAWIRFYGHEHMTVDDVKLNCIKGLLAKRREDQHARGE